MKTGSYTRVTRDSLPNVDEDIFRLVSPISEQLETISRACRRNLSPDQNLNTEMITLDFPDDTAVPIKLQKLNGYPIGVILLWEELFDYAQLAWKAVDKDKIQVKISWSSSPSTVTTAKILVIGQ